MNKIQHELTGLTNKIGELNKSKEIVVDCSCKDQTVPLEMTTTATVTEHPEALGPSPAIAADTSTTVTIEDHLNCDIITIAEVHNFETESVSSEDQFVPAVTKETPLLNSHLQTSQL